MNKVLNLLFKHAPFIDMLGYENGMILSLDGGRE